MHIQEMYEHVYINFMIVTKFIAVYVCIVHTCRCEDARIVVEVGGDSLHFYHSVHVSRVSY